MPPMSRLALGILCLAAFAATAAAKRPVCPGGHFVPAAPLLPGSATGGDDVLSLDATTGLAIGSLCGPAHVTVKGTRRGTTLKSTLHPCGSLTRARVTGLVAPDCVHLDGKLTAPHRRPRAQKFTARRPTSCGDGVVDSEGGEECEQTVDCPAGQCVACTCATSASSTSTSTTTSTTLPVGPAQACVDAINQYRASIGLAAYQRWTANETCADGQALSDAQANMAHSAFGACGEFAQNECPDWPGPPLAMIPPCFQLMWAEGPGSDFQTHGHYINMSSTQYTKVACGFTVLQSGDVWAVQDFQ
jgi:hypothetical protein